MSNRVVLVTAARRTNDIAENNSPMVIGVLEETIVQILPPGNKPGNDGLTKIQTNLGGYGAEKGWMVFESMLEIEASRSQDVATGLVKLDVEATGNSQGTAVQLAHTINVVDTATATSADGVLLQAATVGKVVQIVNASGVALDLWPASGESIDALADDAQSTIAIGARVHLVCEVAGTWTTAKNGL